MKLRSFEITLNGKDIYVIKVDGKPTNISWNKAVVDDLKKYHPELDGTANELVSIIMGEITAEFNLTEDEIREYTQTLKYILED